MIALRRALATALLVLSVTTLFGQASNRDTLPGLDTRPKSSKAAVAYLFPEQVTISAGKPSPVDLHFRISDGLHINSNKPHTEGLIPTTFKIPDTSPVHMNKAEFPEGAEFAFPLDPKEKLSVYTEEFTIHTEISAPKGEHLVEATLRYQACDNSSCMPPHSIPVVISVIAK